MKKKNKVSIKEFGVEQRKLLAAIKSFSQQEVKLYDNVHPYGDWEHPSKKKEFVEDLFKKLGFVDLPQIDLKKYEGYNYSSSFYDQYYFHPAGIFMQINYSTNKDKTHYASSGHMELIGLELNEIHDYSSATPIITQYGKTLRGLGFTQSSFTCGQFLYSLQNVVANIVILECLEKEFIDEFDPFYIGLIFHGTKTPLKELISTSGKAQDIYNFYQQSPKELLNYINTSLDDYFSTIEKKISRTSYYNWKMHISDELDYIQRQKTVQEEQGQKVAAGRKENQSTNKKMKV